MNFSTMPDHHSVPPNESEVRDVDDDDMWELYWREEQDDAE